MDNNGWADQPGVPLNSERDGWHWVESAEGPVPALWARPLWRHCRDFWDQRSPEWMEELQWRYLRPCSPDDLSPAEVDARLEQSNEAWRDVITNESAKIIAKARRAALEELERHFKEAAAGTPLGHEDRQRGASTYNWLMYCVSTIRALKGEGDE